MAAMLARLSEDELMSDPRFAREVDAEWETAKADFLQRARDARKQFKKRPAPDLYVRAMEIYNKYYDAREAGQWDNAFYFLHLYLNFALKFMLHRAEGDRAPFHKAAGEVLTILQKLQGDMNACMRGIRLQIIEHKRPHEQLRRAAEAESGDGRDALAAASGSAAGALAALQAPRPARSAADVAAALDALRLDGKRTDARMYGAADALAGTAPRAGPPSYDAVMGGDLSGLHGARAHDGGLDRRSLRVLKVTGDGHCAFRAIAQGLAGGRLGKAAETEEALQLRRAVAAELERCAEMEMTGTGLTVEQLVLMKDDQFPTFPEYVAAMRRSMHAGETEFLLLAQKMRICISIFQSGRGGQFEHFISYGDEGRDPVKLLWQRGMVSEAGNHYDLLI